MKKFWSYVSNGSYSVGCTGQTVYVYDKNENEIAKFKSIPYSYTPMISPDGKIFVVKTTTGRMSVYSLETMSLIRKFRCSKVDCGADDGFCFSPDGKLFYNIEHHTNEIDYRISVYDTADFTKISQFVPDSDTLLSHIEYNAELNCYLVLGFRRDQKMRGFIAEFVDNTLKNIKEISEKKYDFYRKYKDLELMGFTEKANEWTFNNRKLSDIISMNCKLSDLL